MRILILGGGTVGSSVAKALSGDHDVTIVDINKELTDRLDEDIDARILCGSASQSSVLFQAGATTADICLALTGNDEVNIVGASMAHAMGTRRTAARIYAKVFRDLSTFDYQDHFGIDRMLSIEHLTAMELARRIREPGAMLIEHFACGELEMQEVVITRPGPATGVALSELHLPSAVRIGTIARDDKTTIATAADKIEPGDRITILGDRKAVEDVKKTFQTQSRIKRNVVIGGGGEIALHLAQILITRNYNVRIIEEDRDRCEFLSRRLTGASVLCGDASEKNLLAEEHIGESDIFVGCLGDDENNIMACVEAGELGTKTLLAVISRPDYAEIVGRFGISEAVSPQALFCRQVEGLLHTGPVLFRNPHLLAGNIDVVELEVQKDAAITQVPLKEANLPKQAILAAVIRDNTILIPDAAFVAREGDNVIALVNNPSLDELAKQF
ncbi:MAG: Trk system potassium transporter TrkA [Planctomycetia bacterium]|nr:Trk system potassium transporter TrkA [Planctomycetia bacterium]